MGRDESRNGKTMAYYKTSITVTVLSSYPYEETDLGQVMYDIMDGVCVGGVQRQESEMISQEEMKEACLALGADPEYFGIGTIEHEDYGMFKSHCPYCGEEDLIVREVTLSSTGETIEVAAELCADGFDLTPYAGGGEGGATQDEVVRCMSCGTQYTLAELLLD